MTHRKNKFDELASGGDADVASEATRNGGHHEQAPGTRRARQASGEVLPAQAHDSGRGRGAVSDWPARRGAGSLEHSRAALTGLPSEAALYERYERFARLYFDHRLPPVEAVTIEWSRRMTSAAGRCYPQRKLIRLSTHYHMKFPDEVDGTLLHEMIHLLVPNHGPAFHAWIQLIRQRGGVVHRYSKERATPARFRWRYSCRRCGVARRTQRRLAHGGRFHRCRRCGGGVAEERLDC